MLLNYIPKFFQKFLYPLYSKSFVLKNIDTLIFANFIIIILYSTFAQSDNIAYFAILGIILTAVKILTKPGERFSMSAGDKFLLIYIIMVIISVAGSSLFALSLKGALKTLIYVGYYISVVHYLRDNRSKIKYILLTIACAAFAESIIAIKQNILSVSEISGWQDVSHLNPEEIMTRVYGSLKPYNPNLFGGYMLAIFPASLTAVFLPIRNKHYKTTLLGLSVFLLSVITIFLTGCRGAYLGLFFQLILIALLTMRLLKPFYKKIFTCVISAVSVIAISLVLSLNSLRARILSIFAMRNDSSNAFRFNVYQSCVDMFKDNWLLGIGVGNQNFRETYGLYMKTGFDALSAYNIYLETAVESGIFALLAFLGFLISNIFCAIRYIFSKNSVNSIYIIIAITSVAGMLVHGLVDTVFFRPQIQFIFWIMIGIIRVLTFPDRKRRVHD